MRIVEHKEEEERTGVGKIQYHRSNGSDLSPREMQLVVERVGE